MYNSKKATEQINSESKYLTAGIHDNCTIASVKVDKSPTGLNFIEIVFKKEDKTVAHTEWEPKRFSNQTEDDYNRACNRQLGRFLQILGCFYSETELDVDLQSFSQLCDWVKSKLSIVLSENKPLRVKIVYNKNGFTTLPPYAKYKFIEPMSVTESKIEKRDNDLFERPIVADTESNKTNPFSSSTPEAAKEKSDLPF